MPKLVCDKPLDTEKVSYYTLAGLPGDPKVDYIQTSSYGLSYELNWLPPGNYKVQASACNAWNCSLPAPLEFTVPVQPSTPISLYISFLE